MMLALALAALLQAPGDSLRLTLAEAQAQARALRAQRALAGAQVAEARAAFRAAGTIPNPVATYSHSEAIPVNHMLVEQPLDWLLRRGSDRAAARAGIARAEADSALTMVELAHEVRLTFWRARAALLAQSLVAAQAGVADSLARLAAARLRAGDISLLEQQQAAQEAARARQTVSVARESARIATVQLARAVGTDGAIGQPTDPLDSGLDQMPDTAITIVTVPAVRAALADSAAAAHEVVSAKRSRVPFPSLQAGAEWGDDAQPGTLAVVGFAVPLPLWHRNGSQVAGAEARAARVAALAREARLDAARLVREAHIHLDETARRARVARDSLMPAAAELRARALRAYQSGETGILPVLDALRSEREVGLGAVQDELAYQEAVADWYALTGATE